MARSTKLTMNWFADDDSTWVANFNYVPGSPGSYWDPPEGDEVEFLHFDEELDNGQHGPCRRLDLDDIVELYGLKQKDIDAMEEKARDEAVDFLGCDDDEPDHDGDDVCFDEPDPIDTLDIEFDR